MTLLQRWTSLAREALVPSDSRFQGPARVSHAPGVHPLGSVAPEAPVLPASIAGAPAPVGRLLIPAFGFAIGAVAFLFPFRRFGLSVRSLLPLRLDPRLDAARCPAAPPTARADLAQIASVNLQIYHETAEILAFTARRLPRPRISLAPEETAATVLLLGGSAVLARRHGALLGPGRGAGFSPASVHLGRCLQISGGRAPSAMSGGPFRGAFPSPGRVRRLPARRSAGGFGVLWAEVLTTPTARLDTAGRGDRLASGFAPLVAPYPGLRDIAAGIVLTGPPVQHRGGAAASILLLLLAAPAASRRARRAAPRRRRSSRFVAPLLLAARAPLAQIPAAVSADPHPTHVSIWRTCLDAWRSFPIFGSGPGRLSRSLSPHPAARPRRAWWTARHVRSRSRSW